MLTEPCSLNHAHLDMCCDRSRRRRSRVLSIPFRSPALVAKMAESLDRLSGGRLIVGLGAGATDEELHGFGLPVPSPRDKIDGLADALSVTRGLGPSPGSPMRPRSTRSRPPRWSPNRYTGSLYGWAPSATAPYRSAAGLPTAGSRPSAMYL